MHSTQLLSMTKVVCGFKNFHKHLINCLNFHHLLASKTSSKNLCQCSYERQSLKTKRYITNGKILQSSYRTSSNKIPVL